MPTFKTCSTCGQSFSCYNSGAESCWCEKLPNIMQIVPGQDCLCESCLQKVIEGKIIVLK